MPLYSISTGVPTLDTTLTSLTLGYGPNQTAPPDLLIYNGTAGTITLPAINPVLPSAPATPGTSPGVGDGFTMTIRNQSAVLLTVTPAGSDAIENLYISGAFATVRIQASTVDKKWYNIGAGGGGIAGPIRSVAGNATVATTDRFLVITTAGTVTIPAVTNFPIGAEFVSIVSSNVLVTVTPTAGNINGLASMTIAAGKGSILFTDGTNFFASSTT